MENINNTVRTHRKANQWKNIESVIEWVNALKDKYYSTS